MPSGSVVAHRGTEHIELHRVFLFKREVTEAIEDWFIIDLGHRVKRGIVDDKPLDALICSKLLVNCLLVNRASLNSVPQVSQ